MYDENAPEIMHEIHYWFCWKEFLCENCAEEILGLTKEKEVFRSRNQSETIVEDSNETPADGLDLEGNQRIFFEKESLKVKTHMPHMPSVLSM
jgi:hypothetical protein